MEDIKNATDKCRANFKDLAKLMSLEGSGWETHIEKAYEELELQIS